MNGTSNQQTHPRTWLITGATSGIGRELTLQALESGDVVSALARDTASLDELTEVHGERLLLIQADVRDEQAVREAVERTLARFGRIDVVANNAGYGLFGAIEEASDAQIRAVFDTNVFGVLNVLRATLPVLRAQRSGHSPRFPPRRGSPQASGPRPTATILRCAWPSAPPAPRACAPHWRHASQTWTAGSA